MGVRESYEESIDRALMRIREHIPEDLVQQFANKSGITKEDIHPIVPGPSGTVTAVDGSNAMIAEGGSISLAAIRAARTTFTGNERTGRSVTPLTLVTIGPGHRNTDFDEIFEECFGIPPHKGLDNADSERTSAILRDTLEYWVTLETAKVLAPGSLLLMDGALRVSSQNHEPVLADIIKTAAERKLLTAAVAKRTRATWGGGHPLLPALSGLVAQLGITGPWWTKIDPHILDNTEYRQGRHGEIYVASLHPKFSRLMKMELPKGTANPGETMQALAACADDGRIPGYPYPLLDAHRTVVIDEALVTQVQQDIKAGLSKQGIRTGTLKISLVTYMVTLNDIDTADTTKFRLIGRSVLSYRFIIPHSAKLFVGDILKITDATKGYSFYAKVSDLVHESNFADERWDTRPFSEHFYGLGEDVFIGVEAVPLGFVDENGTFKKPRTLPTKFSEVKIPETEDFAFLTKVMGDIEVGVMRTGQGVLKDIHVKIPSKVIPQHMGVFATTGMGKSNFMKTFCASCMKMQKFGLLVVDPHGEYVRGGQSSTGERTLGLVHYSAGMDGLAVFTISETDRKKYSLNSLWLDYDDFRMTDLNLLYDLSQAQHDVIESLDDFSGSEIIPFFMGANVDTLQDEVKQNRYTGPYPDIAEKLGAFHPGTLQVIQRRIKNIVQGNRKFFRESGSCVPEILRYLHDNKVVLIDIPRMGERSELFVLSMITRRIMQAHRKSAEEFGIETESVEQKKVLITIEEAQRVLGAGGSSTQIFRECAMEGRKFGVGLCVVTQQPKNIDQKVLAQINTFVVMGLGDRGDRDIIMGSAKQDLSKMEIEIQTLDQGEAIISTIGIPFPVSTRIHYYEDYIAGLNKEKKTKITDGLETGF